MGKLEDVLELIKSGVGDEREIAEKLGIPREEVEDIIKILESLVTLKGLSSAQAPARHVR
jgi:ferrous iron transport protein C